MVNDHHSTLTFRSVSTDHPDAVLLTEQVQAYYVEIYGGPDSTPMCVSEFEPPRGRFFVAYSHGSPVAMGGWRSRSDRGDREDRRDGTAEIKRMYVAASARGRGVGRALLATLETSAVDAGMRRLVLETGQVQRAALGLYRSSGYQPVARFGHYAAEPNAVHLGKTLAPRS